MTNPQSGPINADRRKAKAGGIAADKIKGFADRFSNLLDNHKADVATLVEEVKGADLDAATLRKIVAVMRQDATKHAEKQALFDQYLFLAGLAPTPAELPADGEIAQARALFADGLTIRDVAKAMNIGPTKAHALKVKAAAFDVPVRENANKRPSPPEGIGHNSKRASIMPCATAWQGIIFVREEHEARSDLVREAERENRAFDHHRRDARNRIVDADDLAQPPFLKRHRETVAA